MANAAQAEHLFTIGHSNLELEDYLKLLAIHDIHLVCDVRSSPRSSRFPQFSREPFEECIRNAGLKYRFMGDTLGGRPEDPKVYFADGRVNYELRRKARDLQSEIERVLEFSETCKLVLMCAEEDPLQCHRFLMICPELVVRGAAPRHIRKGGKLESQADAEDRLLKLHNLDAFASGSLFVSERDEALKDALRRQAKDFAFQVSPGALESF
jgi:uncharacterized protein (DUF488 family)